MKIDLLRHAKVIHQESFFSKGKIFDESRIRYNISPVECIKLKIKAEDFPLCYLSSQYRAVETTKMVYNGKFIITDEFIEVPSAAVFFIHVNLCTRQSLHFLDSDAWVFIKSKFISPLHQISK